VAAQRPWVLAKIHCSGLTLMEMQSLPLAKTQTLTANNNFVSREKRQRDGRMTSSNLYHHRLVKHPVALVTSGTWGILCPKSSYWQHSFKF